MTIPPNRRRALLTVATGIAALAAPRLVMAQSAPAQTVPAEPLPAYPRHNSSGFQMQDWRDHFDSLGSGVIVADFASRALHYWSGDGTDYRLYPTSVPLTEELTKRGYTEVVRKRVGPDWTPTANMRARDPSLPAYLPPGKDNPLGTHAMYLTWPAYLIHGTHDTRKIGRPSSSGCVGLYNEHIEQLFNVVPVGTRVRII